MNRVASCSAVKGFRVSQHSWFVWVVLWSLAAFAASGCRPQAAQTPGQDPNLDVMPTLVAVALSAGERLQVVATTSIVADVVQNVGGDRIALKTLMPPGVDPHAFEPTPQDISAVADAHVVFSNGAGLETFLAKLLASAGTKVHVVPVSAGVELLAFGTGGAQEDPNHAHELEGSDPHTWFDPNNVLVWAENVALALSALDPGGADAYQANAAAYEARLHDLDAWIREQLAVVPEANRKLVTDHASFSYFVHRYGFEQVGVVFPGYSTMAAPSVKELANLEDAIGTLGVKAVFVGVTVNPDLAQRVASDTGTQLVSLYTGSLSESGGPAGDYISFMRYNVAAIAGALR